MKHWILTFLTTLSTMMFFVIACSSQEPPVPDNKIDKIDFGPIWVDPAFNNQFTGEYIVVWFKDQFLSSPDAYSVRQSEFSSRLEMREQVKAELKQLSNKSFETAKHVIDSLINNDLIEGFKMHWIINGFSCRLKEGGIEGLVKVPGVDKIFKKTHIDAGKSGELGASYIEQSFEKIDPIGQPVTWNLKKLRIPEIWEDFNLTGDGILNVVHDFGMYIDVPTLSNNLYRNPGEIPGNNIDDDENGFVDDYHGYNFDDSSALINNPQINFPGHIHATVVAGIICGRYASDTLVGIAPNASLATVRGLLNLESEIEWAIDQGADTYTMSFSFPNLGEFRTHWRKLMEQGSYCGIFFISGAGNFGDPSRSNYQPVPFQMRTPENIPAVFGVAGLDSTNTRQAFSSQGPVIWDTNYYDEGQVDKPDFSTYNFALPFIDYRDGSLKRPTAGNSFSGPHLAGIIALALSANPEITPWEMKKLLTETVKDVGNPGFDFQTGYGLVDPYELIKRIK